MSSSATFSGSTTASSGPGARRTSGAGFGFGEGDAAAPPRMSPPSAYVRTYAEGGDMRRRGHSSGRRRTSPAPDPPKPKQKRRNAPFSQPGNCRNRSFPRTVPSNCQLWPPTSPLQALYKAHIDSSRQEETLQPHAAGFDVALLPGERLAHQMRGVLAVGVAQGPGKVGSHLNSATSPAAGVLGRRGP